MKNKKFTKSIGNKFCFFFLNGNTVNFNEFDKDFGHQGIEFPKNVRDVDSTLN
jgi:hypothetical protein